MDMRKVGPPPLEARVTKRLLDLLCTDDGFRELFVNDTKAALIAVGYVPSADIDGIAAAGPERCLQISSPSHLASKDQIMLGRAKLEKTFNGIHGFACPTELLAD